MQIGLELLSTMTHFEKYARYIPDKKRRENYLETVERSRNMMVRNVGSRKDPLTNLKIIEELNWAYEFVKDKKVLPSMRNMQFAGKAIERNHARIYNCWYANIEDFQTIAEMVFLLLSGGGVGYSVRKRHIDLLPSINKPDLGLAPFVYTIEDTIEGWANAYLALLTSYAIGGQPIVFDYSKIRKKGTPLITSGGKAPGPEKLALALKRAEALLASKVDGHRLTSLDVHHLMCMIADAIKSGGIRRSAMICIFDADDYRMINCKSGDWYDREPWLANANNSAAFEEDDEEVAISAFDKFWDRAKVTQTGDPGLVRVGEHDGLNPCAEVGLHSFQACNLTEINGAMIETQEDLNNAARAAAIIATAQATFTDFTYLRDKWREVTEREALIGVGITGLTSGQTLNLNMTEAAQIVLDTNERFAKLVGINAAARTTVIKPSGSTSSVLGCNSGVHDWHYRYFVRHALILKNSPLYNYVKMVCPGLVNESKTKADEAYLAYPVKIDDQYPVANDVSALDFLDRVNKVQQEWVLAGHRYGDIKNNVSNTITIRPDIREDGKTEWDDVQDWVKANWKDVKALSWTPKFENNEQMMKSYPQPPFMVVNEEEFTRRLNLLNEFTLDGFIEEEDLTDLQGEQACGAGGCEV